MRPLKSREELADDFSDFYEDEEFCLVCQDKKQEEYDKEEQI